MDGESRGSGRFARPARLVDIAKVAGVSIKTVSRVLNEEPFVSDEMRARVLAAATDLGYVADSRAKVLRTNRSGYLGLIVPDVRNGFFAGLTHHLERRLSSTGQSILLGISDETPAKEERYLRLMRGQRVDGLVVVPTGAAGLLDVVRSTPTVVLDRTFDDLADVVDHVLVRNREAARTLTEHLIGHHRLTRLALISGEAMISSVHDRQLGFADAVEAAGVTAVSSDGHSSQDEAAAGALQLFRSLTPPFGVLATGNRMLSGTMTALSRLGLRVPQDVAVVTFDGIGDHSTVGPAPTRAVLPVPTMAARAVQLLTERTNEPDRPIRTVVLDCDIEYGVTCGCAEPEHVIPSSQGLPGRAGSATAR